MHLFILPFNPQCTSTVYMRARTETAVRFRYVASLLHGISWHYLPVSSLLLLYCAVLFSTTTKAKAVAFSS